MTLLAVLLDEIAFFLADETSSNPDVEIINALKPSLMTTGGPLIGISSPYARKGVLWEAFNRDFGPDGDPQILVAQGASRDLNPSLPQAEIDREYEKDHSYASAEYGAQFRTDLESFVSPRRSTPAPTRISPEPIIRTSATWLSSIRAAEVATA